MKTIKSLSVPKVLGTAILGLICAGSWVIGLGHLMRIIETGEYASKDVYFVLACTLFFIFSLCVFWWGYKVYLSRQD